MGNDCNEIVEPVCVKSFLYSFLKVSASQKFYVCLSYFSIVVTIDFGLKTLGLNS